MVDNPERASRGGSVEGQRPTDARRSVGKGVSVSNASFDPGYSIKNSLGDVSKADLVQGYCGYGKAVGQGSTRRD